jgi:uncharacterized membrane protein
MKAFFLRYRIPLRVIEILLLVVVVYSKVSNYNSANIGIREIGAYVFGILLVIKLYEFWELVKNKKAEINKAD